MIGIDWLSPDMEWWLGGGWVLTAILLVVGLVANVLIHYYQKKENKDG